MTGGLVISPIKKKACHTEIVIKGTCGKTDLTLQININFNELYYSLSQNNYAVYFDDF